MRILCLLWRGLRSMQMRNLAQCCGYSWVSEHNAGMSAKQLILNEVSQGRAGNRSEKV